MRLSLLLKFFLLLLLPVICFAESPTAEIAAQTSVIGTPENPTIEGGLLNAPHLKKEEKHFTNNASFLADEFNNDKNIKSFLTDAAKDGKLATVLQRAEQLKLPATVALIPMVESGYQTHAVSPKGAKGAWQLMPETAKAYGVSPEIRDNFAVSTDAALHLLSDLHQQFGNWTLAFAAYNAGSTRLKKALVDHPTAQKIEALSLPLETRNYVHRLRMLDQTITRLSINPAKLNFTK